MAITFDVAIEHFKNNTDISGTAVFLDDVEDTLKELRDEYAPTIEMTQAQYDIFNSALVASKESENDFIYFIDNLDTQSHFYGDIFGKELSVFINDSRYLMQAWLHPETIKVVD